MKNRKTMQIIVITTLILIPALYAFIFLGAYWNPAAGMSNIPVAVVNNDAGGTVNGESRNIGNDLTQNLKDNDTVKWVFTNKEDADSGVRNQKYYAELVIPADFTASIASVTEADKTQGTLYFTSNDKNGMLAASMIASVKSTIESNVNNSLSETIINNLITSLTQIPGGMQQLSDSLAQMQAGAAHLSEGAAALEEGQTKFNDGLSALATGLGSASSGSATLKESLQTLADKSMLFADGLGTSAAGTQLLFESSGKYLSGLAGLTDSLNNYLNMSSQMLGSSKAIAAHIQQYLSAHPESAADPDMQAILSSLGALGNGGSGDPAGTAASLTKALAGINSTYAQINGSIQKIQQGLKDAAAGASALQSALTQASQGASTLSQGVKKADNGADTLSGKSADILEGETQLLEGITQISDAITLMKSTVDKNVAELTDSMNTLQGLGAFAAQPVEIHTETISKGANTGAVFSPFVLSLCLYIGGLMIMITIYSMESIRFKETKLTRKLKIDFGLFRYQLLGMTQAALIAFIVQTCMGLAVQSTLQFYAVCMLSSLVFTTIVQVLTMLFNNLGKLLSLILMMCQLTACGGVLPVEVLPSFYSGINPYMPMTYTISALRNVILGIEPGPYAHSLIVMSIVTAVFAGLIVLLSYVQHKKMLGTEQSHDLIAL